MYHGTQGEINDTRPIDSRRATDSLLGRKEKRRRDNPLESLDLGHKVRLPKGDNLDLLKSNNFVMVTSVTGTVARDVCVSTGTKPTARINGKLKWVSGLFYFIAYNNKDYRHIQLCKNF